MQDPIYLYDVMNLILIRRSPILALCKMRVYENKKSDPTLSPTGHVHLTDFNIAAIVKEDLKATSIAGTKPYMGKHSQIGPGKIYSLILWVWVCFFTVELYCSEQTCLHCSCTSNDSGHTWVDSAAETSAGC